MLIFFDMDVQTRQFALEAPAGSGKEIQAARRIAVIEVLMRYNLLNGRGDMSTNLQHQVWTRLIRRRDTSWSSGGFCVWC
jgi:hypothetical protein